VTIATGTGSCGGGGSAAQGQGPSPPRHESPPLRLSFTSLSLAPWAVAMPSLHALCVTLSAEVQTDSSEMPNVVPVALRSPIMLKTADPLALDLECVLPAGMGSLQLNVLHEAVPGSWTSLAVADLDLGDLHSAPYPLTYSLPVRDDRAVQAGTIALNVERIAAPPPSPALAAAPPPITALPGALESPSDAESRDPSIALLEAELSELRQQASALEGRTSSHRGSPDAPPRSLTGAALPKLVENLCRPQMGMQQAHAQGDWRTTSIASLARTLNHLSNHGRDAGQATLVQALEDTRSTLIRMVDEQARVRQEH